MTDKTTENPSKVLNRCAIPKGKGYKVAIICGDMKRFQLIRENASQYKEFGHYLCWTAAEFEVDGELILMVCHGVGSMSSATIIVELIELGVKCIIRSGTCGTFQPKLHGTGDICIPYAGVKGDTASQIEISAPFPSVADPDVVEALRVAGDEENLEFHFGIAYSTDLFYRTGIRMCDIRNNYIKCGVAIEDTENTTLFTLATIHNIRSGAICTIDGCPFEWNLGNYSPTSEKMNEGKKTMVRVAVKAAMRLSRMIKEEEAAAAAKP
ncbi:nucleoside phosphorylase domain containing protein [Babesia gibsoni]|uniref:Nucleoside phosphorylase domain containing protein n=1 Tax=Babesia gibsoni TaxID=33632 RepID=A0AAD8PG37_BABGI|nr:nucleoside phosphorylase domain containing protein [Babesia gibsoni]